MKAALCKSLDGPRSVVIEDVAEPVPGAGQAVVRVTAAALNFFDTLIVRGKYQFKPDLPFSPCGEIAGVVEAAAGDAAGLIGKRVAAYVGWGGAREKIAVGADALIPIPDGVPDGAAACVSVTYGTAIHGFAGRARLQPGETVAVLGASGGAGLAALEIAKLMGARTIAVASSDEKLDVCRAHGADVCVNYANGGLKEALRDATGGRGADVVYDCVGADATEPALRALAWGGRLLVIGFAGGDIPRIPLNLLLLKGSEAVGVFWGEFVKRNPERHRQNMEQVLSWAAAGKIAIPVRHAYPLSSIAEAIALIDNRQAAGKVVITL